MEWTIIDQIVFTRTIATPAAASGWAPGAPCCWAGPGRGWRASWGPGWGPGSIWISNLNYKIFKYSNVIQIWARAYLVLPAQPVAGGDAPELDQVHDVERADVVRPAWKKRSQVTPAIRIEGKSNSVSFVPWTQDNLSVNDNKYACPWVLVNVTQ